MRVEVKSNKGSIKVEEYNIDAIIAIRSALKFYSNEIEYEIEDNIETGRCLGLSIPLDAVDNVKEQLDAEVIVVLLSTPGGYADIYVLEDVDAFSDGLLLIDEVLDDLNVGKGAFNTIMSYPEDGLDNVYELDGFPKPPSRVVSLNVDESSSCSEDIYEDGLHSEDDDYLS